MSQTTTPLPFCSLMSTKANRQQKKHSHKWIITNAETLEHGRKPWGPGRLLTEGPNLINASRGQESCLQCRRHRRPGLGRSPGERNGNPLQCSCLENLKETEEPGGPHFKGSQRVGQAWAGTQTWVEGYKVKERLTLW